MDELPALQRLPGLQLGLAEARKYGGCFLVGCQSKPQLEEIYGEKATSAILDLLNTKIFFRCTNPSTQVWISRILGDKEEAEPSATISYGAHSMRDGVSLTHQFRHKPLIMPGEFAGLLKILNVTLNCQEGGRVRGAPSPHSILENKDLRRAARRSRSSRV